jgi:hypothetical protein
MEKLKACPFCGGNDIGEDYVEAYSIDSSFSVFGCRTCGGCFREEAITEKWNSRPREEALERLLREAREHIYRFAMGESPSDAMLTVGAIDAALKEGDHGTT